MMTYNEGQYRKLRFAAPTGKINEPLVFDAETDQPIGFTTGVEFHFRVDDWPEVTVTFILSEDDLQPPRGRRPNADGAR